MVSITAYGLTIFSIIFAVFTGDFMVKKRRSTDTTVTASRPPEDIRYQAERDLFDEPESVVENEYITDDEHGYYKPDDKHEDYSAFDPQDSDFEIDERGTVRERSDEGKTPSVSPKQRVEKEQARMIRTGMNFDKHPKGWFFHQMFFKI